MQVVTQGSPALPVRPRKSTTSLLKWLLALALAGVLLYVALRGVEWRRVEAIIAHCRWEYLSLACGCAAVSYIVRAMRWRLLLTAQQSIAAPTVLWASSVGYLANSYLPARAGEFVRTEMISSRTRLARTYVFTTAMAERVIELIVLVFMAWLGALTLPYKPAWLLHLMLVVILCAAIGTAFLLTLPAIDRARSGFIAHCPASEKTRHKLHNIAENVTLALAALRSPARLLQVCAVTSIVWLLDAACAVILAHALGMHLLLAVSLLLSTGLALGNALPSTPGAIGIVQFAAVTVLTPFHFARTDAIAYILVAQAASYFVITTLGLIGLWQYRCASPKRAQFSVHYRDKIRDCAQE
jgi:uncharacterized protein (TIRG00374 family)